MQQEAPYVPTQEQIRDECERIKSEMTDQQRAYRDIERYVPLETPVVRIALDRRILNR